LAAAAAFMPTAAVPSPDALMRMDRSIRDGMAASDIPGMPIAVVAHGHVVHARGFGQAGGSGGGVTQQTPFVIGSRRSHSRRASTTTTASTTADSHAAASLPTSSTVPAKWSHDEPNLSAHLGVGPL
jgi:hypothetical protein